MVECGQAVAHTHHDLRHLAFGFVISSLFVHAHCQGVDGGDALQRVLGSVRTNHPQREGYRNLRAGTRQEWYAEPAALPASAWGHSRTVPEHGTTARKCERWWNEAHRSEIEQTVHRQTGFGKQRKTGHSTRQRRKKTLFRSAPLPLDFSLESVSAFLRPQCCDRLSCWLEGDPGENLSTRLQAHWSANEYKTATRVWPAYRHAESETR